MFCDSQIISLFPVFVTFYTCFQNDYLFLFDLRLFFADNFVMRKLELPRFWGVWLNNYMICWRLIYGTKLCVKKQSYTSTSDEITCNLSCFFLFLGVCQIWQRAGSRTKNAYGGLEKSKLIHDFLSKMTSLSSNFEQWLSVSHNFWPIINRWDSSINRIFGFLKNNNKPTIWCYVNDAEPTHK